MPQSCAPKILGLCCKEIGAEEVSKSNCISKHKSSMCRTPNLCHPCWFDPCPPNQPAQTRSVLSKMGFSPCLWRTCSRQQMFRPLHLAFCRKSWGGTSQTIQTTSQSFCRCSTSNLQAGGIWCRNPVAEAEHVGGVSFMDYDAPAGHSLPTGL